MTDSLRPDRQESELDAYDYELPKEMIAQSPLARRTDARMMVVDRARQSIEHCYIRDFPRFLRPEDTLVLNNTKVIPARLIGRRESTGARWEGLFLRFGPVGGSAVSDLPEDFAASDQSVAEQSASSQSAAERKRSSAENSPPVGALWEIMSKTRGKLRTGETILLEDADGGQSQRLEVIGRTDAKTLIVRPLTELSAYDFLDRVGWVPIPPYIRAGRMVPEDREHYQTVYATRSGAVAAPTAGLHFTKQLLAELQASGVAICPVTLHVGAGTFKPITVDKLSEHQMHSEWASISPETVELILQRKAAGGRTIAVGTTSVRTLESAANADAKGRIDSTGQNDLTLHPFRGETDLFIRPPYRFKVTDALLTNFHLPKSTLIILVRTFGGDALMKRAYEEAIAADYRFFSYGDAMLIL